MPASQMPHANVCTRPLSWRRADHATQCCQAHFACKCGAAFKGMKSNAKKNFTAHGKKCSMGAAPLPVVAAN